MGLVFLIQLPLVLVASVGFLALSSCVFSNLNTTKGDWQTIKSEPDIRILNFLTKKGNQVAFYMPPEKKPHMLPEQIVLIFPGYLSEALDRLDWARALRKRDVGVLLLDYPGRGFCEGRIRPKHLPWTSSGALSALAEELNVSSEKLKGRFYVLGHSFGCGAALQFSEKNPVQSLVLLAPFATLKQSMFRKIGPLAWLIPDNLNNKKYIKTLIAEQPETKITIIHGILDESIPVQWGRKLASIDQNRIDFIEISNGTHISILTENNRLIFDTLLSAKDI